MIKSVEFENFRNVKGKYDFKNILNAVIGKNNSGKTNLLDGIKLAFSVISSDYYRINQSDFYNSDDSLIIKIIVELDVDSIPTLNYYIDENNQKCGFIVNIRKTQSGRYIKEITLLNGSNVDYDILREDENIPSIFSIPVSRIEEIYTNGLITGISKFIDSEEKYKELKNDSKEAINKVIKTKVDKFKDFCKKFNQNFEIDLTEPKISDEKVYIVEEGQQEHNYKIGAGYKSIANIILNALNEKYNIILIDEIENHLHPSLIRTLIRELNSFSNIQIICTTHSAVVANELGVEEIIDINYKSICLDKKNMEKLNTFMHAGRNELMFADNIVLVEGYTEEMLFKYYLSSKNYNWNVINVAGIMFEPYIELAAFLHKKLIVVSDNDKALSKELIPSSRFVNLENLCKDKNFTLLEVNNTLESDLYDNNFLASYLDLLEEHEMHKNIYVAKANKKTMIAQQLIMDKVDLSDWHIIKDIENEFNNN